MRKEKNLWHLLKNQKIDLIADRFVHWYNLRGVRRVLLFIRKRTVGTTDGREGARPAAESKFALRVGKANWMARKRTSIKRTLKTRFSRKHK